MTIDTLPIVTRDTDGNTATIPLGELCCVCVERPADGAEEDELCAECRDDWRDWLNWRKWQRNRDK